MLAYTSKNEFYAIDATKTKKDQRGDGSINIDDTGINQPDVESDEDRSSGKGSHNS